MSCASSNWALRNAKDQSYVPYTYPNEVTKMSVLSDWLVLDIKTTAEPEKFIDQFASQDVICFAKADDFANTPVARIDGAQLNARQCLEGKKISKLPGFTQKPDLTSWFLMPSLGIAIEFYPNSSAENSLCSQCDKLGALKSKVVEAYKFSTQRFYLKLKDGSWVQFSRRKSSREREFEPKIVKEKEFLNEKRKVQKMKFTTIDDGYYVKVSMPQNKNQIFYSKTPIIKNKYPVNRLVFNRVPQERVVEKGSAIYYAFLPFTVVADVITFPYQWYMLMKATSQDSK